MNMGSLAAITNWGNYRLNIDTGDGNVVHYGNSDFWESSSGTAFVF
jgi:hypothetical protein